MFVPELAEEIPHFPISRTNFLPGDTTLGHYQIELACESCHTERFNDRASLQSACVECHAGELEFVDDSHPRTKFTDPRNADRVASLDARYCVTCHREHRPELTGSMGLSLPGDYCYRCHQNVADERPTHEGLAFDSCASSGCHNFHDNRALYEDFLVEHRAEPDHLPLARVLGRSRLEDAWPREPVRGTPRTETPLSASEHDAPDSVSDLARWVGEWAGTRHAESGVNCRDCHGSDAAAAWSDRVAVSRCQDCHRYEVDGFLASRHGMRIAAGLAPMSPAEARLPMQREAYARSLDCNACHGAHAFDTSHAAVEACLECHADEHSLAYESSPHHLLWQAEQAGDLAPGAGVSCASCHLPRLQDERPPDRVLVSHNQNDFLRPGDKMIRAVCMSCHGLGFSIDALADAALVRSNFRGDPAREVESIHYATTLRWELEGRKPPWERSNENETNEEQVE